MVFILFRNCFFYKIIHLCLVLIKCVLIVILFNEIFYISNDFYVNYLICDFFPEKQQKQSGLNDTLKEITHTAVPDFTWVLAYRKGCDWTLVSPSSSPSRSTDPSPHPLPPPPPVSPDLRCRSSSGWTALYQFCGPLSGVSTGLWASSWLWETPCTLFTMFTAFAGSWSNLCMVVIVKLVPKLLYLFRSPEAGKHTCWWFLKSQTHTHL